MARVRRLLPPVLLLAIAGAGFAATRVARLDMRYAAMNPVREQALLAEVQHGGLRAVEAGGHLSFGSESAAETLYVPPVLVLRLLSLGHQTALADILFVRAHSYFLSHFFADRVFRWLDDYYEAIVGLDPDNPKVYLWAAQVAKYGQMIDDTTISRANSYLEAGLARFPDAWQLHLELAFNLYFELKEGSDEVRAANKLKARDHFAIAAAHPDAAVDPNFVAELYERGREDRLAAAYALERYYEANEQQREQIVRRVGNLSRELAAGVRDEETRWHAEFPFIPVAIFSLTGGKLRPGPRQDVIDAVKTMGM